MTWPWRKGHGDFAFEQISGSDAVGDAGGNKEQFAGSGDAAFFAGMEAFTVTDARNEVGEAGFGCLGFDEGNFARSISIKNQYIS